MSLILPTDDNLFGDTKKKASSLVLPGDELFDGVKPAAKERTWGEVGSDAGIKLAQGVVKGLDAATGLVNLATFGGVRKAQKALGLDPDAADGIVRDLGQGLSDKQKEAEANVEHAEGFTGTAKALLDNPTAIAGSVLESVPSMVLPFGAARGAVGGIVKSATQKALQNGATREAAELAGRKALEETAAAVRVAWAAHAGEGAMTAGGIAQEALKKDDTNPAAMYWGVPAGFATAAIGRIAGKAGLGDAEASLFMGGKNKALEATGNRAVRAAKGAVQEGVLEEMPQSMQEQVFTNLATGKPMGDGVAAAGAQGLLTGGAMGGAMSGLGKHGSAPDKGIAAPSANVIADEVNSSAPVPAAQPEAPAFDARQHAGEAFADVGGDESFLASQQANRANVALSLSQIGQQEGEQALVTAIEHLSNGNADAAEKLFEASQDDELIQKAKAAWDTDGGLSAYIQVNDAIRQQAGISADENTPAVAPAEQTQQPATAPAAPTASQPHIEAQVQAVKDGLVHGAIINADVAQHLDLAGLSHGIATAQDGTQALIVARDDATVQNAVALAHEAGLEQMAQSLEAPVEGKAVVQRIGQNGEVLGEHVIAPGEVGSIPSDGEARFKTVHEALAERASALGEPQVQTESVQPTVEAPSEAKAPAGAFFSRKKKAIPAPTEQFTDAPSTGAVERLVERINAGNRLSGDQAVNPASIKEVAPTGKLKKLTAAVGTAFGVKLVFVDAPNGLLRHDGQTFNHFSGVADRTGKTVFISTRANAPLAVLGHELVHILETEHPAIYDKLELAVIARMRHAAARRLHGSLTAAMKAESQADGQRIAAEFRSEVVAEGIGEMAEDASLWADVFAGIGSEKTLAKQFYDAVIKIVAKLQRTLTGQGYITGTKDMESVKKAVTEAFQAWGKKYEFEGGNLSNMTDEEQVMLHEFRSMSQADEIAAKAEPAPAAPPAAPAKPKEKAAKKPAAPKVDKAKKTTDNASTTETKNEPAPAAPVEQPAPAAEGSVRDGGGVRGSAKPVAVDSRTKPGTRGKSLVGLAAEVKVDGKLIKFGGFKPAQQAARQYAAKAGIKYSPVKEYVKVDPERAKRIAQAFEEMKHDPADAEVKAAYDAMIKETLAQWEAIKKTGLKVEFIDFSKGGDPYGNPRNAIIDVVQNNHLWVFPTSEGFGGSESAHVNISGNPLMDIVPGEMISGRPVQANDIFRIVHDYFGHIEEGVGFRADGEENAWRVHSSMYSPLARRAMTTETRGQNSWVNFGPHSEFNKTADPSETQYAPQKVGLLPMWVMEDGSGQPAQPESKSEAPAAEEPSRMNVPSNDGKPWPHGPHLKGRPADQVKGMDAVVDYMNGDIDKQQLIETLGSTALPEGVLHSITMRLGDQFLTREVNAVMALQGKTPVGPAFARNPLKMESVQDALDFTATGDLKLDLGDAVERGAWADAYMQAKDAKQRGQLMRHLADTVIETFVDSKIKVVRWAQGLPLPEQFKQRLIGDLQRSDTIRSFLEKEVKDRFVSKMFKAVNDAAKANKLSTDQTKKLAGYWMTARYVAEANQMLISKDRTALLQAQATGDANQIAAAQQNLNERIQDVNGAIGAAKVRGVAGGMNNAEAAQMLQNVEAKLPLAQLQAIAQPMYDMLTWKKAKDLASGKVTQSMVNSWLNSPNYVPLTGDPRADRETMDVFSAGNQLNQAVDHAMNGRKDSVADDAIDAAFSATIKSINFAAMQDFKRTLNEAYQKAQAAGQDIGLTREPVTGIMRTGDAVILYRDAVTARNGLQSMDAHAFKFKDARIMEAIRRDNVEAHNSLLDAIAAPTRWYARAVTQFMPTFAPINFVRDIWERSELLRTKTLYDAAGGKIDVKKAARASIAETINGKVWKATIAKSTGMNGQGSMNYQERRDLEEMIRLGGSSTWGDYLDRKSGDLERSIRNHAGPIGQKVERLHEHVKAWNESFELVPTLAIYRSLKAQGMAPKEAAAAVLDLMNFRKKGTIMPGVKALYVFAQPAAASGYNLAQYLSTRTGKVRFVTQLVLGLGLYSLLKASWGDDEDEEIGNKLDNLSNFTVERTIPINLGGLTVKAPVGFGPPQMAWQTAVTLSRWGSGRYTGVDALGELAKGWGKNFAPVAPSDIELSKRPLTFLAQTFTPTVMRPMLNILVDETSMGAPLTPQFKDPDKLKSEQAKRTTAPVYSEIARSLEATLGVDIFPDQIKAMSDGYLVGPLREVITMMVETPAKEARGEKGQLPLVHSLIDVTNDRTILNSVYYRLRKDMEQDHREFSSAMDDPEKRHSLTADQREKERAYQRFLAVDKIISGQRNALDKMTHLDDEARAARLQGIESRADEQHRRLLKAYMQKSTL